MNQKILETLEFQKVKNLVEPYLQTEQGEVELQELSPLAKKEAIVNRLSWNGRYGSDLCGASAL